MTRKEAWPFYRTISGVRLCWELEDLKDLKVHLRVVGVSHREGKVATSFRDKTQSVPLSQASEA